MDEFKQLYEKYKNDIYKYLFYLSGDNFIAEELTQETFVAAYQSIHRFKGDSKVSTWLFQIAKYTFYNYLRNKKKDKKIFEVSILKHSEIIQDSPEETFLVKYEIEIVLDALRKLEQPQQHIVILRIFNELSFKAIGEIFDQSDVWARVNFYRAKNKLLTFIERGENRE